MQRIMPFFDEYETLLANDASRVFNSARNLFSFLLRNISTMLDSVTGPEWDSAELNDEYVRLLDEMIDLGTEFDQRLEALLVKRAELQKTAKEWYRGCHHWPREIVGRVTKRANSHLPSPNLIPRG